jgi:hypothetical protein
MPWYIPNLTLHKDLNIPYVTEVIRVYAKKHKIGLLKTTID